MKKVLAFLTVMILFSASAWAGDCPGGNKWDPSTGRCLESGKDAQR